MSSVWTCQDVNTSNKSLAIEKSPSDIQICELLIMGVTEAIGMTKVT